MIKVGTSGFSFQDWIGTVYPSGIKREEMLSFYEKELGFKTIEINFTYYSIPSQKSFESMIKKTTPDFTFTVKAHKSMTHEIKDKRTGKYLENDEAFTQFLHSIEPLIKEGRLLAILAQFPYSFYATNENYHYILDFKKKLKNIPLVIEFRNDYWHNEKSTTFLKQHQIGYCIVDEPKLRGLMPYNPILTSHVGYFRFHGRNRNWFHASREERYDYLYTKEELQTFVPDIKYIAHYVKNTIVMFNNCHVGKAARNALDMIELLK